MECFIIHVQCLFFNTAQQKKLLEMEKKLQDQSKIINEQSKKITDHESRIFRMRQSLLEYDIKFNQLYMEMVNIKNKVGLINPIGNNVKSVVNNETEERVIMFKNKEENEIKNKCESLASNDTSDSELMEDTVKSVEGNTTRTDLDEVKLELPIDHMTPTEMNEVKLEKTVEGRAFKAKVIEVKVKLETAGHTFKRKTESEESESFKKMKK